MPVSRVHQASPVSPTRITAPSAGSRSGRPPCARQPDPGHFVQPIDPVQALLTCESARRKVSDWNDSISIESKISL